MKVEDIVQVNDGSYSKSLIKGVLSHHSITGGNLRSRRFRVLAVSGMYPTNRVNDVCGTNDIMLVDTKDSDFVLFTQVRFCRVVTPAPEKQKDQKQKDQLEIVVPRGTKGVHLTFEK